MLHRPAAEPLVMIGKRCRKERTAANRAFATVLLLEGLGSCGHSRTMYLWRIQIVYNGVFRSGSGVLSNAFMGTGRMKVLVGSKPVVLHVAVGQQPDLEISFNYALGK